MIILNILFNWIIFFFSSGDLPEYSATDDNVEVPEGINETENTNTEANNDGLHGIKSENNLEQIDDTTTNLNHHQQQQQQHKHELNYAEDGGDSVGVLEAVQPENENGALVESNVPEPVAVPFVLSQHEDTGTYPLHHTLNYHQTHQIFHDR